MSARDFIAINAALALVWVGLGLLLGRMYAKRSAASQSPISNAALAVA